MSHLWFSVVLLGLSDFASAATQTTLIAKHSQKCVDVFAGLQADGTVLIQYNCGGWENQNFTFEPMSGGSYRLVSSESGKCLAVASGSTASGANLVIQSCGSQASQRFQVMIDSEGYTELKAEHSGHCVEINGASSANEAAVVQRTCSGGSHQRFKISDGAIAPSVIDLNAVVSTLAAQHSQKCLDVNGGLRVNGTALIQYDCGGWQNQDFRFEKQSNGTYQIVGMDSGKCLDLASNSTADGATLVIQTCGTQASQRFNVNLDTQSFAEIISSHSGRCVEVNAASTANESTVVQRTCSRGAHQRFKITRGSSGPTQPAPTPTPAPTPPPSSGPSGPIHSGIYTISGQSNVTIDGLRFTSSNSDCVRIVNSSNVRIRNISIVNCYGVGVVIENSSNVTVEFSYFENLNGGVYAVNSTGIKANNNRFKNVARAGKLSPHHGVFVQYNQVYGAGNEVNFNRGINEFGKSDPEDLVNLYSTTGTASSPVIVDGNCFQGGGPSASGGGIMTGDENGSHTIVRNNTLVDPGQYGIGIAGGTNIQILNNKIYGRQQYFTNVGLYIWNQYNYTCANHTIRGNQVEWFNSSGSPTPSWDAGNCGTVQGWAENNFSASLSQLRCSID